MAKTPMKFYSLAPVDSSYWSTKISIQLIAVLWKLVTLVKTRANLSLILLELTTIFPIWIKLLMIYLEDTFSQALRKLNHTSSGLHLVTKSSRTQWMIQLVLATLCGVQDWRDFSMKRKKLKSKAILRIIERFMRTKISRSLTEKSGSARSVESDKRKK